ncbi:MAG: hypothetical protein LBK05_00375 [Treponema sp.]|jgi:hypothetical protein|nr:hypothetical protein [Treponema sp.]
MRIYRIENIVNIFLLIAAIFLDRWYPYLAVLIKGNDFFAILLKYVLLYFFLSFMGEIVSIIYLYNKKKRSLSHVFDNVQGLRFLLFFPVIFIVGLTYIGIMYSLYIQIEPPYVSAIMAIFFGFFNGFQTGMEKYYEESLNKGISIGTKKTKNQLIRNEKPFDHSFNNMISISLVLFLIFYPTDYFVELFFDNIIFTVSFSVIVFMICYKINVFLYKSIFIHFELEHENNLRISVLYGVYLLCCFIGFIYYDSSIVNIVENNLELNDFRISSRIILLIMTGYLPIRLIPILFSARYKFHEKIINAAFVIIYMIKKIL